MSTPSKNNTIQPDSTTASAPTPESLFMEARAASTHMQETAKGKDEIALRAARRRFHQANSASAELGPFAHSAPSTAPTTARTEPAGLMIPPELFHDHRQQWYLPTGTVQRILSVNDGTFRRGFTLPDGSQFAESSDETSIQRLYEASSYSVNEVD